MRLFSLPKQICVTYNKYPVMAHIGAFLQETERKGIREEYFEQRLGILPQSLNRINTYALGRVFQRSKTYRNTYSKIMHKQLNIILVNIHWMMSDTNCPLCHLSKEDRKHIITCNAPVQTDMRNRCISDFDLMLAQHNTYPPLHEFLVDFITQQNFSPHEPDVVNPRYGELFQRAYKVQNQIGWEIFSCGLIAHEWKCLLYQHDMESKTKDIRAITVVQKVIVSKKWLDEMADLLGMICVQYACQSISPCQNPN